MFIPDDYDAEVTAEMPSPTYRNESGIDIDNLLYSIATPHMIHGPCGPLNQTSPCMVDGKCSKKYPRAFVKITTADNNGYLTY